jgi:hypothetical protein
MASMVAHVAPARSHRVSGTGLQPVGAGRRARRTLTGDAKAVSESTRIGSDGVDEGLRAGLRLADCLPTVGRDLVEVAVDEEAKGHPVSPTDQHRAGRREWACRLSRPHAQRGRLRLIELDNPLVWRELSIRRGSLGLPVVGERAGGRALLDRGGSTRGGTRAKGHQTTDQDRADANHSSSETDHGSHGGGNRLGPDQVGPHRHQAWPILERWVHFAAPDRALGGPSRLTTPREQAFARGWRGPGRDDFSFAAQLR